MQKKELVIASNRHNLTGCTEYVYGVALCRKPRSSGALSDSKIGTDVRARASKDSDESQPVTVGAATFCKCQAAMTVFTPRGPDLSSELLAPNIFGHAIVFGKGSASYVTTYWCISGAGV